MKEFHSTTILCDTKRIWMGKIGDDDERFYKWGRPHMTTQHIYFTDTLAPQGFICFYVFSLSLCIVEKVYFLFTLKSTRCLHKKIGCNSGPHSLRMTGNCMWDSFVFGIASTLYSHIESTTYTSTNASTTWFAQKHHSYSSRTLQINLKIILFTLALLRAHVSNSDTEREVYDAMTIQKFILDWKIF